MSADAQIFTYKPALLAKSLTVQLGTDFVSCFKGQKELWHVKFADIAHLRYTTTIAREIRFRRFEMRTADGALRRFGLNASVASHAANDEQVATYEDIVSTLAKRLHEANRDLKITIGEGAKLSWIMFSIGMACLLFAGFILVMAWFGNIGRSHFDAAIAAVIAMLVFGVFAVWTDKPWAPRPEIELMDFADSFVSR